MIPLLVDENFNDRIIGTFANSIKGIVNAGRLELDAPRDWPDGTEVMIEPVLTAPERIGIEEREWSNDPPSLADWGAWIQTIEPLEITPEETEKFARFDQQMREYNLSAVKRQMEELSHG